MVCRHAALAILTTVVLAACGSLPLPDQSPPEVVLHTYLAALKAGDCERAGSLATPTFIVGNGELCGALEVTAFTPLAGPATPDDREVVFATTLTTRGGDVSMPDGNHRWFYILIRQPNGAWRLAGGGTGP